MTDTRSPAPALLNKLEQLYSHPAPISSPRIHAVKAAVLDAPIVTAGTDNEDVVYIASAVLDRLCPACCTLVDLVNAHVASSMCLARKTVRAKLVPLADPPVPGSFTAVAIPPVLAHNLGLMYQLQPFMTADGPSGDQDSSNSSHAAPLHQQPQRSTHIPVLYPLQLIPVLDGAQSTTTVSAANNHLRDRSSSRAVCVAQSVTICKVTQPVVTPFGAAGKTSSSSSSSGSGSGNTKHAQDHTGPANSTATDGLQDGEAAAEASTSSSSSDSKELLQQLQRHFTRQRR